MRNFLIVLTCISIFAGTIFLGVVLGNYMRQVRWEDFTKMHDYINHREVEE